MAAPLRIVVADDHPIVRSGIVALLQSSPDLEVVGEAANGEQAVALALALNPDLMLMDLRMPELDGDQATAQIVAARPDIRIIILTTYESDDNILRAIEAGASGYLLKAAPHEEILAGVRSVARGEVALSPTVAAQLVRRMAAPPAAPVTLSGREAEVLTLVAQGHSNRTIAESLLVSEATVKTHLLHAFAKLGVNDRTRAVTLAMELGLLPPAGSPRA